MDKYKQKEKSSTHDIPKLPIKTYHWEDVKRSRKKGAYPWTHLSKPPFDEEVDEEEFTMDAFRRSRSTSTLGKSEKDFFDNELQLNEEISTNALKIQSEDNKTDKNRLSKLKSSSNKDIVNIGSSSLSPSEDKDIIRSKSVEPRYKRKLSIESGKSGASVSKLGLMDKLKSTKNKLLNRSKSDASDSKKLKTEISNKNVAKKAVKPKLAPVKDESPVYIHIPLKLPPGETDEFSKYEFESAGPSSHSASLTKLPQVGSGERKLSLMGILAELKKVQAEQQKQKLSANVKEDLREDYKTSNVPNISALDSKTASASVKETKTSITVVETINITTKDDDKESNQINLTEIVSTTKSSILEDEKNNLEKTLEEVEIEPEENSDDNISQYLDKEDNYEQISEKSVNISSENLSKMCEINMQSKQSLQSFDTKTGSTQALENTLSKWKQRPSTKKLTIPNTRIPQRAKSEEPKRKRRSSIDSSHSRKSLSKLGIAKKFKEAKDKIKLPKLPSFTKLNKKSSSQAAETSKKKTENQKAFTKTPIKQYPEKPVYIHIPLKPPPGTTDEFSSLEEYKDTQVTDTTTATDQKNVVTGQSSIESNDTAADANVQFIYLTAPSDDEILDSNIPETPSESDQKFFETTKVDDLKVLAKTVISTVYPEPKKLETVTEDEANGQQNTSEVLKLQILAKNVLENEEAPQKLEEIVKPKFIETNTVIEESVRPNVQPTNNVKSEQVVEELIKPPQAPYQINQQMFIDEEDGLKLSDAAIAMINEEMAKEFNKESELLSTTEPENSPVMKKKVSFKRRSTDNGDDIYEDLELNSSTIKSDIEKTNESSSIKGKILETFQSMSVDEEKSYLDKEVVKHTSLDEDYNKWSSLNDHEYEPVNPPPEEIMPPKPNIHPVTPDVSSKHHTVEFSTKETNNSNENINVQDMQNKMEEYFSNTPARTITPILKETKTVTTNLPQVTKEETNPLKKESSLNKTLRDQAGKIKIKFQNFKNASIKLPPPPKFSGKKLKKPNFKMPKMPQRPSLPSLGIVRKKSSADSWKEKQLSTESNVSSSTGNIFDFRTYPRIFKKNKRRESPSPIDQGVSDIPIEFATVPRTNKQKNKDYASARKYEDKDSSRSKEFYKNETKDVIRIPLHSEDDDSVDMSPHNQYREDIDNDDDYNRDNLNRNSPFNKDYLKRWDHGEFHENPQLRYVNESDSNDFNIHNFNNDMEESNTIIQEQYVNEAELASGKEEHSSGSLNERRQGVLEEIDSDEFFLREKGISQENIEVGKYLSSEIREAFRNPLNSLQFQSEDKEYDLEASDQSEPSQNVPKRKPLRKPKRKKTPHVSKEQISFDQDSVTTEPDEYLKEIKNFNILNDTPTRPKRKSNKSKKNKPTAEDVIPYQETIPIDKSFEYSYPDNEYFNNDKSEFLQHTISESDLQRFYENELQQQQQQMYENEFMQGIEQPEISVSDLYNRYENFQQFQQDIGEFFNTDNINEPPTAPKRKQRSLKSLTVSEPETNIEESKEQLKTGMPQSDVEVYRTEEYIIPTPEPPKRSKKYRSRTHSPSLISQGENNGISRGEKYLDASVEQIVEPPIRPKKRRSRTHSPFKTIQQEDDIILLEKERLTVEVPTESIEDSPISMHRSLTRSISIISQQEDKTSQGGDSLLIVDVSCEVIEEPCVREICDHMGYAVINKSRINEPPLPPSRFPATPPVRRKRKNKIKNLEDTKFSTVPRSTGDNTPLRPLRNYSTLGSINKNLKNQIQISQDDEKENIEIREYAEIDDEEPVKRLQSGEVIKKMKDRPLPAPPRPPRKSKEFREVFRDISHERNIPTESQTDLDKISINDAQELLEIDRDNSVAENKDTILSNIENQILSYDHEETVTHGSLIVQPINDARILPAHEFSQNVNNSESEIVRIIPIDQNMISENTDNVEEETSYVPEEFKQLKNYENETTILEDDDETSEIPEEFKQLKNTADEIKVNSNTSNNNNEILETTEELTKLQCSPSENLKSDDTSTPEISTKNESQNLSVLKAERLQVQNLDADKLRVNELQATKIIVSELDGVSLQVKEINSKSGNLVISGIELPPQLINQMLDQLQSAAHSSNKRSQSPQTESRPNQSEQQAVNQSVLSKECDANLEENEAIESNTFEAPPVPPRYDSKADLLDENLLNVNNFESESSKPDQAIQHQDSQGCDEMDNTNQQQPDEHDFIDNPPTRPPRKSSQIIQNVEDSVELTTILTNTDDIKLSQPIEEAQQSETHTNDLIFSIPPTHESLNSLPQTDSSKSEEEPPPRPPQPLTDNTDYVQSRPPLGFYALRSPQFIEFIEEDIPLPPRRKRHHKSVPRSKSSSDDNVPVQRRNRRSSEPTIPQLTGQLVRACTTEMERSIKRLISHFRNNVLQNADGQQDSHVMILILLILIAGLILLSCDEKINIHHHHWEYFNPPKNL